jgi:arginase
MRRPIILLDAPSNLGLRPPAEGVVPGAYKLAGALRDQKLLSRLGAIDSGVLTPPRYVSAHRPGEDRNGAAIAAYSRRLADRLGANPAGFQLVLGGDCSILIGICLHLSRKGRYGLLFLDGHSDFRHPENFPPISSAAGEDLAIVSGRGDPRLSGLAGDRPMMNLDDVVLAGVRPKDPALPELRRLGAHVLTSDDLQDQSPDDAAAHVLERLTAPTLDGFWVHFDVDVIDAAEMPAVDCPEPNGPSMAYIAAFLRAVISNETAGGMNVTIYDPDLDEDGAIASRLADLIVAGCDGLRERLE